MVDLYLHKVRPLCVCVYYNCEHPLSLRLDPP